MDGTRVACWAGLKAVRWECERVLSSAGGWEMKKV